MSRRVPGIDIDKQCENFKLLKMKDSVNLGRECEEGGGRLR